MEKKMNHNRRFIYSFYDNKVVLPKLHIGQIIIAKHSSTKKLVCCGRRWGKSYLVIHLSIKEVLTRQPDGRMGNVGIFCPSYKYTLEIFNEIALILKYHATVDRTNRRIVMKRTGAVIEFWSLNDPNAGRSRSYSLVCIDEAAFVSDDGSYDSKNLGAIIERSIMPTLLDREHSRIILLSTPSGKSGYFYEAANDGNWDVFHAPTSTNPHISEQSLAIFRKSTDPLVWAQEYEAQFVDFAGEAFLRLDLMLNNGNSINVPIHHNGSFTGIFAVMDTAFGGPDKIDSDGTAYIIFAFMPSQYSPDKKSHIYILDWGIEQISGDLLKDYLERVSQDMHYWSDQVQARFGVKSIMIEEKGSGIILLQQAQKAGLDTIAVNPKLVTLGKDARVLSTSNYLNQNLIHLTQYALEKEMMFKKTNTNHLIRQLSEYRINDKARHKKNDDLVDAFCYAVLESFEDRDRF